jgi:hypothetical protein
VEEGAVSDEPEISDEAFIAQMMRTGVSENGARALLTHIKEQAPDPQLAPKLMPIPPDEQRIQQLEARCARLERLLLEALEAIYAHQRHGCHGCSPVTNEDVSGTIEELREALQQQK